MIHNGKKTKAINTALIFAAGLGTRFKPWTDHHPKALAEINGKCLLQRNIEYLQEYGIYNVVINLHHFANQIITFVQKNKGWGSNIYLSDETSEILETGGGLLNARSLIGTGTFLTLNADILTDANLKSFLALHLQESSLVTVAVRNRNTSRYLLFNKENQLTGWRNIKTGEEKIVLRSAEMIEKAYSGMAIFEPEIFELIPFKGKFSLIDVYLALAPQSRIAGFDHSESRFIDVGKPGTITLAEAIFR